MDHFYVLSDSDVLIQEAGIFIGKNEAHVAARELEKERHCHIEVCKLNLEDHASKKRES